jgi:hypothetical protein
MVKKHHTHELELVCIWGNGTFSLLPSYLFHLTKDKGEAEAKGIIADKYGCELLIACRGCLKDLVEVDFGCPENPGAKHDRELQETLDWVVDQLTTDREYTSPEATAFRARMRAAMEKTDRTWEARAKANRKHFSPRSPVSDDEQAAPDFQDDGETND